MTQILTTCAAFGLSAVLLLGGCATQTASTDAPAAAKPAPLSATAPEPRLVRPFEKDTLYELLVAEFAGKRERADLALGKYHKQAHQTRDLGVIERANAIARYLGSHQVALDTAMLWMEVDPESTQAREVAASQYIRDGQLDKAMVLINELLAKDVDVQFEFLLQGLDQADIQVREQVLRDLELINQRYPGREQLWFTKGVIEERMGRSEQALASFQQALSIHPGYINAILGTANLLEQLGQQPQSLEFLATKTQELPKNRNLGINYARKLIGAQKLVEAQAEFSRLAAQYPDDPELILSLGLLAWQNEHLELAKAQFLRLLELNQRRDDAHYYLGRIFTQQENHDRAQQHFLQIRLGKQFANARIQVALSLQEQGKLADARQSLADARALSTKDTEAFYLAEIELLNDARHYDQALAVAEQALAESPDSLALRYSRALMLTHFDRFTEMEQELRQVLADDPNHAAALNALGYTLADRNERLDEAYELINKANELSPNDAAIIDSLGWIAYRRGELAKAIELLRKAYDMFPDQEVAAHLGEVLWVDGQHDAAKAVWQEGLEKAPDSKKIREAMDRLMP